MKLPEVEWPTVEGQFSDTEEILPDVAEDIKDRSVPQFLMKILLIPLFNFFIIFLFKPCICYPQCDSTKTTDPTRFRKRNIGY